MSTHYRKGQIWSDPTGNYGYIVKNIDPLEIATWGSPNIRLQQEALEGLTDSEREDRFPRLHAQPKATPEEIRAGLIGRTIEAVEIEQVEGPFPQGDGDITLTLDDGNIVGISSWGYDASRTDVYFETIPVGPFTPAP
jgi:hypothetical protein